MKRKYVITLSIVIALWVAFMAYRHVKGKRETEEYRAKEFSRMTVAVRQSPRAGLAEMGRALKAYNEEKRAYPSSLSELHPKYVGNKSLIDEIDWYYEPRGDNFYLSKTVIRDNRRMIASIDKGLRAHIETGVMVARPTPGPEPTEVKRPEGIAPERPEITIRSREEFWEALRLRQMGVTPSYVPKREEASIISADQREVVSVVESEVTSDAEAELSRMYLVWKDKGGILGFGNVEYPVADRQIIYSRGSWYNVKVPLPEEAEPVAPDTKSAETEEGPEVIASTLRGRYLVWKGQQDILGFGNVEYPQKDHVYVFQTDTWVRIDRPVSLPETGIEEDYSPRKAKSTETIASELSTQYLVWKDQQSTLGFGNVQYPEKDPVSVFQDDTWVGVERPSLPAETIIEQDYRLRKSRSTDTVSSELSTRYLVWKDEHGTLGFGNTEYPEEKDMAYVHVNGTWEKVMN